jgi:proton-translocating NADH-quinone oxidoreductase chain L
MSGLSNATLAYITLFAPLAATAVITLFTLKQRALSAALSVGGIAVGLVCSILMAVRVFGAHGAPEPVDPIIWLQSGGVTMEFGVQVDALSVLMSLVVTGVGLCIFVFSTGYMKGEEGWSRYFACLSLFAFSMLGIVFSPNLVETFIFWELVGVSSYALIGYYFHKPSAVDAGKKAFLTNRIGDFGMTCGILLLYFTVSRIEIAGTAGVTATFSFDGLKQMYDAGLLQGHEGELALGAFCVFTGALAKSAQVPLHVWLPDAMEGPTPVSALMHAATMVAAGVYMVCRTYFLFVPYHWPLATIAVLGGVTAFLAATMAFVQTDCKKVLAYSTLSQLGYMTMALGLHAPGAAMFHLTTHACFKALLFLCAGSVIAGCHHEQDMRWMGGLRKRMPITAATYAVGGLALAGIAPLSGFFSKDAILGAASVENKALYVVGLCVAFMTACYMGRAWCMTFLGEYRGPRPEELREKPIVLTWTPPADDPHGHGAAHGAGHGGAHAAAVHGGHAAHGAAGHGDAGHGDAHGHGGHDDHGHHGGEPHESPWMMTLPLVVLALLSIGAGFLNVPKPLTEHGGLLEHALIGDDAHRGPVWFANAPEEAFHWDVAGLGTFAALLGGFVAWMYYGRKAWSPERFVERFGWLHRLVVNKYYFDHVYLWLVREVQQRIADLCGWIEGTILVRGVVNGFAALVRWFGEQVRLLLDGHLHTYVTLALGGAFFVLALVALSAR